MTRLQQVLSSLVRCACAIGLAAGVAGVHAQDRFPSQPIKLIVPYPPGGTTDIVARHVADQLGRELGQPVVVDNRPGGGTNIGAEMVARAKPDGYTLLMNNNSHVLNPVFGPKPNFDLAALEPVSLVSRIAFVVAANPKVPINNPTELVAAAKAKPGTVTVSSAQLELYVELLNSRAGIKLLHVPYKGGAPATTDAISGQVNSVFALVPVLLPHIQAGKLKAVAVTSGKRVPVLPDTPTLVEQGVNYDFSVWYAFFTTPGTPKAIVDRLSLATQKALATPELAAKVRAAGAEPASSKPEEFAAELKAEAATWQQVAREFPNLVQK